VIPSRLEGTGLHCWDFLMMATQSVRFQGMELLIAYHRNPSIKLRNQLVQLNAGLVRKIAYQISRQCREPYEDLLQIGFIGLIRAIERFNPSQGCAFSSFAMPYIRGEMLHFLRDKASLVKMPRRWQEIQREGRRVTQELAVTLGRFPKDAEIAQALKISLKEWQESKLATRNCLPLSLDATVNPSLDSPTTIGEMLTDVQEEAWRNREEERQQLQGALSQLDKRTQAVIELVFLQELPRQEAAKKIGVSPITVSRYVQRGVNELVSLLQSHASERLAS
jgi:RNA polymerase sigma-B factor